MNEETIQPQETPKPQEPEIPFLDRMLKPDECAQWLWISKRELLRKSKGFNPVIPVVRFRKVYRYHPRTIVEKYKPTPLPIKKG